MSKESNVPIEKLMPTLTLDMIILSLMAGWIVGLS